MAEEKKQTKQAKQTGKKDNDNGKVAAAAVGGAVVGAATAAVATKVLSDPKNRDKIKDAFDSAKDQLMGVIGDLQGKVGEAKEVADDKIIEGKAEAQKALTKGKKEVKKKL